MKGSFAAVSSVLAAAVLLLLHSRHAEGVVINFGACPTLTLPAVAADPFGAAASNWFEVSRYPSSMEGGLKCVRYSFGAQTQVAGAAQHTVTITGTKLITRNVISITGTITQTPAGVAANSFNSWTASFQRATSVFNIFQPPLPTAYNVLGTDGATWIVLYTCTAVGAINLRTSVILTTTIPPTAAQLAAARAAATLAGIRTQPYIMIDQTTC